MKKLLVVLGLLLLVPGLAFAQSAPAPSYFVDYYANNYSPWNYDQIVRIINAGTLGSPLSVPVGDICVNIYVFDANQEMIACCAENLTPNQLDSAYVGQNLTNHPLNGWVPDSGVIKIAMTPNPSGASCDAATAVLTAADASLGEVFQTHLQDPKPATYVTETEEQSSPLGATEGAFLPQTCSFVQYLGSGKTGKCYSHLSDGQH